MIWHRHCRSLVVIKATQETIPHGHDATRGGVIINRYSESGHTAPSQYHKPIQDKNRELR